MARGTTLLKLLDQLRAETRTSLNPAHNGNVRDAQVNTLQRVQEWLWADFDWPHLRVERQIAVEAGQRFIGVPEDLDFDRVERIDLFTDGGWSRLQPGIGGEHYTVWNSDLDQRSWPPRRWQLSEDEQIELWPIPDIDAVEDTRDGYLKFTGIRKLRQLVDDGDVADLDDRLIVLYAAGEILGGRGSKDGKLKLDLASSIYAKRRGRLSPRQTVRMFGIGQPHSPRRLIAHYRPPEP